MFGSSTYLLDLIKPQLQRHEVLQLPQPTHANDVVVRQVE
jgi:hypothetical protein